MRFSFELAAWAGAGLLAWLISRGRYRLGCFLALAAAFAAVPLLRLTWDPEGSERAAEFLSRGRVGLLFGAAGGVLTGGAIGAVLCLPKDRNRRLALGVFVVVGLFVAVSERKSEIFFPFHPSADDVWAGDVCIQTSGATCGPASLATCLRALGVTAKEGGLALESNTSAEGTLFADLARAARSHGVAATFHAHQNAAGVALPAIASVTLPGDIDHFVALIDSGGHRMIADPLTGLRPMENASFYQWSGMFLSLARQQ